MEGGGGEFVYAHSTIGLWRLRFDGGEVMHDDELPFSGEAEKGEVTELMNYRNVCYQLDMCAIVYGSKLILVGGESHEIPSDRLLSDRNDPGGHFLSKRAYICDGFPNPSFKDDATVAFPLGAKPHALAVPVRSKSKRKIVFYVIARLSFFSPYYKADPEFEVFDPKKNSWKALPEPPYLNRPAHVHVAFELHHLNWSRIVLIILLSNEYYELSFDLASKEWHKLSICASLGEDYTPSSMIRVEGLSDDIRIGCMGDSIVAYKFYPHIEFDKTAIEVQELEELYPFIGPFWATEFGTDTTVSDLGNGHFLFMSSSMHQTTPYASQDPSLWKADPWVDYNEPPIHYYFLKVQINELSTSSPGKFVAAKVVDWCHKIAPTRHFVNFVMRTGFMI